MMKKLAPIYSEWTVRRAGEPLGLELPFEPGTARLWPAVWARWLDQDPARFVPQALASFRRLSSVFLDCGTRDEFNLRWGTRMVAEALEAAGVEVVHQEFEDGHRDVSYRYRASLSVLLPRLATVSPRPAMRLRLATARFGVTVKA